MKRLVLATLLCATSVTQPVHAQTAAAAPAAPIEPSRLEAARRIAGIIMPDGTYAELMRASMDGVMKAATESVGSMPLAKLAELGGIPPEELAQMGDGTFKELMAIVDPSFDKRIELSSKAMGAAMARMMTSMEPTMREGLAAALARRFDSSELGRIDQFFATPTGRKYAASSLLIYADPEMLAKMQEMMPKIIEQMPAMMKDMTAATADLPKPREWEDLSDSEKTKFASLLGMTVDEMEDKRTERESEQAN